PARTNAAQRDVIFIDDDTAPSLAPIDTKNPRGELHDLTFWAGVDCSLDLRIVILRTAERRECAENRGAVWNSAAGLQSRLGPIGHPTGRDDLPDRQGAIGDRERCERALPATLLGACRPRPGGCGAAKQGDELAASHVGHGPPSLPPRNNHQVIATLRTFCAMGIKPGLPAKLKAPEDRPCT